MRGPGIEKMLEKLGVKRHEQDGELVPSPFNYQMKIHVCQRCQETFGKIDQFKVHLKTVHQMDDKILLKRSFMEKEAKAKIEFDILEIGSFISLNFLHNNLSEKGANVDLKMIRNVAVHFELYELIELVDVEIAEKKFVEGKTIGAIELDRNSEGTLFKGGFSERANAFVISPNRQT